jgi:amino acid adenylation domain-containing protein
MNSTFPSQSVPEQLDSLDGIGPGPNGSELSVDHAFQDYVARWQEQLSSTPPLSVPTDKPRPAGSSSHLACQTFRVAKDLTDSLRQLCHSQQLPLSITLLSAFQVLLLRYTSHEDIVTGCWLAGGVGNSTSEASVGRDNGFLLRTNLSGDPRFRDLLARVAAGVEDGLEHRQFSLREVMQALSSGPDGCSSIFQVSFSYQMRGAAADRPFSPTFGANLDLHLGVEEDGEELTLNWFYNADLFESSSIDRTASNLQTLLGGIVASLDESLSSLPIINQEEKQRILNEWNRTASEYPRHKCLHQLIEEQAEQLPEGVAAVCGNDQLTYREFNARANQLAHYLTSCGVRPNTKVGVCLRPSIDFAVAILAVLKSGGVCLPMDPTYPPQRLTYMLQDGQAHVLLTSPETLPGNVPADCEVIFVAQKSDILSRQSRANLASAVTPAELAYVIYTSGSTGKPRGVLLPHAGLVNYIATMAKMYSMASNDRVLQFCSISFDIAIEEIFLAWTSGATLVFKSETTPLGVPEFLSWAEQQGITVLDLPTAYWHEWVRHLPELKKPSPRDLRLVIVGGEKASAKAYGEWLGAVGRRVRWVNTYGPTEASIAATASEPQFDASAIPENLPIGRPVPNVRIYLLDGHLNPVPVGIPAELHIAGVGVAQGYFNRPELTGEKFIPDPFSSEPGARMYRTGDLARYLPSGEIEFLGRRDDQIKIRGFRIELGEIESALAKHPGVSQVVVVAKEKASGDKYLVAYLVPAQQADASPASLRSFLGEHLPDYMVPSAFVVLDSMPMTPNGKINRRGLPEPEFDVPSSESVVASDPLQWQLTRIWQEVLEKKQIGIRDNFFDLGGHSLVAARLMHRIGQEIGKTLPLAMLFEAPTIEQLAAALGQDGWSRYWSSLVPIQTTGSQPPFFCVHGVGGNVIGLRELGQCMAPDYPFYGLQSQGLDGTRPCHKTIEEMALHYIHEIRSVQPNGPYFLGGFSFGGLVAYEMAQQLRGGGEDVGLLVLFDTYPGNLTAEDNSFLGLLLHLNWSNLFRDLPKVIEKRIRRRMKWWRRRVQPALWDVRNSNTAAHNSYVLRPYEGRTTLLRAGKKSLRDSKDPHAAWNDLIANLEIYEIPGDHFDILVQPHVNRLAECLKSCVDQGRSDFKPSELRLDA